MVSQDQLPRLILLGMAQCCFLKSRIESCVVQHLTDLDDDCLLNVFSFLAPLPDLISLSKACRVSTTVCSSVHFLLLFALCCLFNSQRHG